MHNILKILLPFLVLLGLSFNFSNNNNTTTYTYLALCDSYTIGESVDSNERWPMQLAVQLNKMGLLVSTPTIIAKTGWRTDQLLKASKKIQNEKFDLVSLLIGVNNEYQQEDPKTFENKFRACLKKAIAHSKKGKKGVFVISIPDYGYTPFGKPNMAKISKRLAMYNQTCQTVCETEGILFIDITPLSKEGLAQPDLVALDGLHPSGKQYELWVKLMKKKVYALLSEEPATTPLIEDEKMGGPPKVALTVESEPNQIPDQMTTFPGGAEKCDAFIKKTLQYPLEEKVQKHVGVVYVEFLVEKDGKISQIQIIKGVSPTMDQEAMRIIKMMPNWVPAQLNGAPINSKYVLPIKFELK